MLRSWMCGLCIDVASVQESASLKLEKKPLVFYFVHVGDKSELTFSFCPDIFHLSRYILSVSPQVCLSPQCRLSNLLFSLSSSSSSHISTSPLLSPSEWVAVRFKGDLVALHSVILRFLIKKHLKSPSLHFLSCSTCTGFIIIFMEMSVSRLHRSKQNHQCRK